MGRFGVINRRFSYYIERLDTYLLFLKLARKHKNIFSQIFDVLQHKLRIHTTTMDYYRHEFYKNDKSWEEKSRYVGLAGSAYYPYAKNSVEYFSIVDNKYIFKSLLKGFNLPQAKLFFSVGSGYEVSHEEDFISRLGEIQSDIVLKPSHGSKGEGISVYHFKKGEYYLKGVPVAIPDIWNSISSGRKGYLVEERVVQKESYNVLNPSSLNTYRIVTIRLDDGELYVARVSMKIGKRGSFVDNLAAGGCSLNFNQQGISFSAYDWGSNKEITHHPDTDQCLIGISMDDYDAVIALAREASNKFGFLGTLGWDIGVSESGPVIIEANMLYATSYNQVGKIGPLITPEIAPRLTKRSFGQRWDKTRVYPGVNRYKIKA